MVAEDKGKWPGRSPSSKSEAASARNTEGDGIKTRAVSVGTVEAEAKKNVIEAGSIVAEKQQCAKYRVPEQRRWNRSARTERPMPGQQRSVAGRERSRQNREEQCRQGQPKKEGSECQSRGRRQGREEVQAAGAK
jgi:hypothetical protein